ncbi:MAG TPA: NlpC/P60 family N-terminal domain-containing protein, partial [Smithellaceae bacterium]|nr:NlpC/P60 family N-terminal domain-containing protein [Smithellaceae bacterium]
MKIILSLAVVLSFVLSGCIATPDTIQDVRELRQDHASYFTDSVQSEELLAAASQARTDEDYNIIYFSVWHQNGPFHA